MGAMNIGTFVLSTIAIIAIALGLIYAVVRVARAAWDRGGKRDRKPPRTTISNNR